MLRPLLVVLASLLLAAPAATAVAQDGPTVTDHVVTSFDGTAIEATLFLPPGASDDDPVPLVLRTHGWGLVRETSASGTLARLLDEGYAVLTWDQRGFGCSGGTVQIDDPDTEGRDVSALIDWAAENAPIAAVGGDPVVGMTGGSYAGGIQTASAAVDDRLDALAPEISWTDLRYSLYSGEVVNQGWVTLLYGLGKTTATTFGLSPGCQSGPHDGGLDPAIDRGFTEFFTTGSVEPHTLDFFAKSSLGHYGVERPVTVPTLVLQGSVDTLFDLADGHGIYRHVRDQGVEARFVAFCGGHVDCPPSYADAGDRAHLDDAIVAWFDRHLRGSDVDAGAPVEYRTNQGEWRTAISFPPPTATTIGATGEATGLAVVPVLDLPDVPAALRSLAAADSVPGLPLTTSQPSRDGDPRAATFPVAVAEGGDLEIVGVPDVTVTTSGTTLPLDQVLGPISDRIDGLDGLEPVGDVLVGELGPLEGVAQGLGGVTALGGLDDPTAHVFVKLVHREAGEVVNLQEGAVSVPLGEGGGTSGATAAGVGTHDVPMPGVAYTLPEGDHLDLQIATHSLMHATGRHAGLLDVTVEATIPVIGSTAAAGDDGDSADGDGGDQAGGSDDTGEEIDATPVAATRPLPVTGSTGLGVALTALLGAAALSRRAPPASRR